MKCRYASRACVGTVAQVKTSMGDYWVCDSHASVILHWITNTTGGRDAIL